LSKPNKKKRSKVTEMPRRSDNGEAGKPADDQFVKDFFAKLSAHRDARQEFTRFQTQGFQQGFLLIPYTTGYSAFQNKESGEVILKFNTSQFFDKGVPAKDAGDYITLAGDAIQELSRKGIDFVLGIGKSCEEHAIHAREERFQDLLRDTQRQPKVDANDVRVYKRHVVPATGSSTVTPA